MSRPLPPKTLAIFILVDSIVVLSAIYYFVFRDQGVDPATMAAAKEAIGQAGGIVVMDGSGKQLATVNLQMVDEVAQLTSALEAIRTVGTLQVLDLSGTPLTDEQLVPLTELKHVNSLHLNETQVTERGLQHIRHLRRLEGLHLAHTAITSAATPILGELTSLRQLDISGTPLGSDLQFLSNLDALEWLVVRDTPIAGSSLAVVQDLPQLTHLTVGAQNAERDDMNSLRTTRPDLTID